MLRKIQDTVEETVTIQFDDQELVVPAGRSVAAALLEAGVLDFRKTPVSAAPRGPFCMMGACFDCLIEIDGQPNRQACMTLVADGMDLRRQLGAASLEPGTKDQADARESAP